MAPQRCGSRTELFAIACLRLIPGWQVEPRQQENSPMTDQDFKLAAHIRAMKIIKEEGVFGETDCIYLHRSHTGGRPCFGYAGKKLTVAEAIVMPAKGQVTRHLCHDEACVNPDHLRVGTRSERGGSGELNSRLSGERQRSGRCGITTSRNAGPADLSVSIRRRSGVNARRIILRYARR